MYGKCIEMMSVEEMGVSGLDVVEVVSVCVVVVVVVVVGMSLVLVYGMSINSNSIHIRALYG